MSRLQRCIWGSLRKIKSGWFKSMKCLRLKMFRLSPSMFQVIALKEMKEGFVGSEASATRADLSGHLSLNDV